MNKLIQIVTNIRNKFMLSIVDYTDPGYSILKKKTVPLSDEESQFVELYQNTMSLHVLSVLTTIPSTICYSFYFFAMNEAFPNQKKIIRLKRGMWVLFPLSIITVIGAHTYEGLHDISSRLKQIEKYYNQNKDKDVNSLRFKYTTVYDQ